MTANYRGLKIVYRDLPRWYYELLKKFTINTGIFGVNFLNGFIELSANGTLTITEKYAWNGASGALDSKSTMLASLVHDALYGLIREGALKMSHRKAVDVLFRVLLRAGGMGRFRAWYFYRAVRMFGRSAAVPHKPNPTKEAP